MIIRLFLLIMMRRSVTKEKEVATRNETDGGREQVVKEGETDHLRSAGRQHKPAEEGQSPLDSVL